MKKVLSLLAVTLFAVACGGGKQPVPPVGNAEQPPATTSVSAPAPVEAPEVVVDTTDPCAGYGEGKENYCRIHQAFIAKFGPDIAQHDPSFRNPVQYKEFKSMLAKMANGVPALCRQYGSDSKWSAPPVVIRLFGPFTGAQHEIGGNEYLAQAAQVQGLHADDVAKFLLQGEAKLLHRNYPQANLCK